MRTKPILWAILVNANFNMASDAIWLVPSQNSTHYSYIFSPGACHCETQVSQYCPKSVASTGELLTGNNGFNVIHKNVSACNFAEIKLKQPLAIEAQLLFGRFIKALPVYITVGFYKKYFNDDNRNSCSTSSTALTSTILAGTSTYVLWHQLNFWFRQQENKRKGLIVTADPTRSSYQAISAAQYTIDLSKLNLGQIGDLQIYNQHFKQHLAQQNKLAPGKSQKVILYGVSRGAATTLAGFVQLSQEGQTHNIGAVICEAPYDSLINLQQSSTGWLRCKLNFLLYSGITRFKADGPSPITMVEKIVDYNVPILLITSKSDQVVYYTNTVNLYRKLLKQGYTKMHILALECSAHSKYHLATEKDRYQNFIHAFYRHYNLPYIKAWADLGQPDFIQSQSFLLADHLGIQRQRDDVEVEPYCVETVAMDIPLQL